LRKKIFFIFILFIVICSLFACDTDQTNEATGYGIVHKDYVGFANIKVTNGTVETLTIDEAYLPNTWAKVEKSEGEAPDDVLVAEDYWYGKYIVIGDDNFVGVVRETALEINGNAYPKQTVKYSTDGVDDLFIWLNNSEANCEWYVNEVTAGNAFVAKEDWTESTYELAGMDGWTKSTTNYWPGTDERLGWSGNMEQFVEAVKGTSMDAADNLVKTEEGYWMVDDVISGATLADFPDYYQVAKRAYDNASE